MRSIFISAVLLVSLGCSSEPPVPGMVFVTIPAGSFVMGSPVSEQGRMDWEGPCRTVTVESFELMTTEVTQGMWFSVMGTTLEEMRERSLYDYGLFGEGEDLPMYYVSWDDCHAFISALNELDPGHIYRLPSEAEWEYACRAGTRTRFFWGDDPDSSLIGGFAWFEGNSEGSVHPVALGQPNGWGLYDMSGNVWEWCRDRWSDYETAPSDGSAWESSDVVDRVLRGGSWNGPAVLCRSAHRNGHSHERTMINTGFRVARTAR